MFKTALLITVLIGVLAYMAFSGVQGIIKGHILTKLGTFYRKSEPTGFWILVGVYLLIPAVFIICGVFALLRSFA